MKILFGLFASTFILLANGILTSQPAQHQHHHGDDQPTHMEHSFEDVERWVRDFDDPARDEWQMPDRVVEALDLQSGQTVADLGAGTGYFTVRLARAAAAPKVYAIDVEPSMVEYVKQRAEGEGLSNVTALLAASDDPRLPEPVDLVLVVNTYHHLPDRTNYFGRVRQLMKPSGRLAVLDYRKDAPDGPPEKFRFHPDQISRELEAAGFRLQQMHDFLPRQIFLVYGLD